MDIEILITIALSILGFGLLSGRLEKSPITPPMVFLTVGLLGCSQGLGTLSLEPDNEFFHILAELTLVLVLFVDASRIDLGLLWRQHRIPMRMLSLGLPLTIVLGAAAALWLFDFLNFWQAAVVAAILAPTDAALGQAVVSNRRVPVRIRQGLNVESGLNDGIALPAVVILISCMAASLHLTGGGEEQRDAAYWLGFTAKQVIFGPLAGILIGFVGGRLVQWGQRSGWMTHIFQDLSAVAMALAAFSIAEFVGGNGFIAAFTAGLTLGNTSKQVCECLYEFGEAEGQLMTLLVFMIFGAAMVPPALEHFDGRVVVYALLSLTLIRMLPVAISLIGLKLRWDTRLFLGWFGPRGIASILFALLLFEETGMEAGAVDRMTAIIFTTVLFSVFLHGLTAYPLATAFAGRVHRMEDKEASSEHEEVEEMPLRVPLSEESHHAKGRSSS